MIMTTLILIMFIQGFTNQGTQQSIMAIKSYIGSDFTVYTRESFEHKLYPKKRDKMNLDMIYLKENKLTSFFEEQKKKGVVKTYNFQTYCMSLDLNDPLYIESAYHNLEIHLMTIEEKHFQIVGVDNF